LAHQNIIENRFDYYHSNTNWIFNFVAIHHFMRVLSFSIFILLVVASCQNRPQDGYEPYDLMPENTSALFKINEVNDFVKQIQGKPIILNQLPESLKSAFDFFKHISPKDAVYLGLQTNDSIAPYVIITRYHDQIMRRDSLKKDKAPQQKQLTLDSLTSGNLTHYYKSLNGLLVGSNSKKTLLNIGETQKSKPNFELLTTAGDGVVASLLFINEDIPIQKLLFNTWTNDSLTATALDLNLSDNSIGFNGVINANDSISSFVDCFRTTIPQNITVPNVIPKDVSEVINITFDDYARFEANRRNLMNIDSLEESPAFLNYTNEIAKADDVLVMHSLDTDLIVEAINGKNLEEDFRGIKLYNLEDPQILDGRFNPFFNYPNLTHFAAIENYVVWTNSKDQLTAFVSSALNNFTLDQLEAFKHISEDLSDEASIFIFRDSNELSRTFDLDLKGYDANVVQFINDDGFAHVNGIIKKYKARPKPSEVIERFTTTLKSSLIGPPQLVRNHVTRGYDIAVQDVQNRLSLISDSGKILWTKTLEDKILGPIEQIDMYKNGRLQLAFATAHRLYVLDRNGNDVSPFPLKFKDEITQPLSVFDYDKNRNYRLLVTQDDNLLMYNARGQRVGGFDYNLKKGKITSQPKHFRIGSKDYIVFKARKDLVILNRRGKTRVTVDQTFNFSDNELYNYQNRFTTSTSLGQLIQVSTKGKTKTTDLKVPEAHHLTTTSKTLVTMTENQLTIKSRKVTLDYGDYTEPRIFYLNDKIYISTTDKEAKKVYLFDSQGKAIPNFPVYGTSAASLENMDDDRPLELVTQDGPDKVLVYEIN
jgi:hypothetical protein